MAISVKLQAFEGPLDLLLHLIEKNKVDIYDIPISLITEQYLEYIDAMKDEDMDIASEFLVMAATLLDIKCRMLLPKEENEDGQEEDPRQELVEKLIEYKLYKYMSYELKDRQIDANRNLYKEPSIPDEIKNYVPPIDYDELAKDMDLSRLNNIFKAVMKRREDKIDPIRSKFGNIEKEDVDIEAKQTYVRLFVATHKEFSFRELLERQSSKPEIVVTFLLILEMIKIGEIEVSQESNDDDIIIVSKIAA